MRWLWLAWREPKAAAVLALIGIVLIAVGITHADTAICAREPCPQVWPGAAVVSAASVLTGITLVARWLWRRRTAGSAAVQD